MKLTGEQDLFERMNVIDKIEYRLDFQRYFLLQSMLCVDISCLDELW